MCHILSGGQTIDFVFSVFCMYVPCAVKMFHLLTAACQYVIFCLVDKRLTLFFPFFVCMSLVL